MQPEILSGVYSILKKRNQPLLPFEKLALVSKHAMIAALMEEAGRMHPLQFIQGACKFRRLCIKIAVESGYPLIPPMHYSVISMTSMTHFCALYKDGLKGKLALARGSSEKEARFTFHLVRRLVLSDASPLKAGKKDHGGEIALHRFICFKEVKSNPRRPTGAPPTPPQCRRAYPGPGFAAGCFVPA